MTFFDSLTVCEAEVLDQFDSLTVLRVWDAEVLDQFDSFTVWDAEVLDQFDSFESFDSLPSRSIEQLLLLLAGAKRAALYVGWSQARCRRRRRQLLN